MSSIRELLMRGRERKLVVMDDQVPLQA